MICIHADQVVIYNTDNDASCGNSESDGNNGNNKSTAIPVENVAPVVQHGIKVIE